MTPFNSFLSNLNSLPPFLHHCIIRVCHPLLIPVTNIIVMILFRISTSSHNTKRQKLKQLFHSVLPGSRSGQRQGSCGEQAANLLPVANRSGADSSQEAPPAATASLILLCFREVKDWTINKGKKTHPVIFHIYWVRLNLNTFLNTYFKQKHQLYVIFYLIVII